VGQLSVSSSDSGSVFSQSQSGASSSGRDSKPTTAQSSPDLPSASRGVIDSGAVRTRGSAEAPDRNSTVSAPAASAAAATSSVSLPAAQADNQSGDPPQNIAATLSGILTDERLRTMFQVFGPLVRIDLPRFPGGTPRGYAFVHYADSDLGYECSFHLYLAYAVPSRCCSGVHDCGIDHRRKAAATAIQTLTLRMVDGLQLRLAYGHRKPAAAGQGNSPSVAPRGGYGLCAALFTCVAHAVVSYCCCWVSACAPSIRPSLPHASRIPVADTRVFLHLPHRRPAVAHLRLDGH